MQLRAGVFSTPINHSHVIFCDSATVAEKQLSSELSQFNDWLAYASRRPCRKFPRWAVSKLLLVVVGLPDSSINTSGLPAGCKVEVDCFGAHILPGLARKTGYQGTFDAFEEIQ